MITTEERRRRMVERNTIHGESGTKLNRKWKKMKERCYNTNCERYKNYGGRGITVCEEWQGFIPFRDWALANGYEEGLSIDRINNDGNYEPSNCRWVTMAEQNRNTSRTVRITIDGVTKCASEWARIAGVHNSTIIKRYRKGEKIL